MAELLIKNTVTGQSEPLLLKRVGSADIPEILALQERIFDADGFDSQWFYPFSREELVALAGEEDSILVGVFAGQKLIAFRAGCRSGEEYKEIVETLGGKYRTIPCFLMNGSFVDSDYRGNNLQQTMTEYCVKCCETKGIETFFTTVHPENTASITSFRNLGFKEKETRTLYGGKYNRIILVKEKTNHEI